jgi:hypothetical protein
LKAGGEETRYVEILASLAEDEFGPEREFFEGDVTSPSCLAAAAE